MQLPITKAIKNRPEAIHRKDIFFIILLFLAALL